MLVELIVENYAIVERVRLRFAHGLNVLTGETGSGKSIIVDALGLLFGGRASSDMIRTGCDRARVAGMVELPSIAELQRILDTAGVEAEDGELLLERELLAGGKSRAFAGSRPVTAAFLREIAPYLGDIHGQHDQQRLFSPAAQREMLDEFGGARTEAAREAFQRWRSVEQELEALNRSEQETLRMADLWSFQRKELEAAALQPGEDLALEQERKVLQNVTRLEEHASAAYSALYESEDSALTLARLALRRVEELARIDAAIEPVLETLRPASIAIEDAAHELRDYLGRLEADPARLEEVEQRLATLDKVKRKYGGGIDEAIEFLAGVTSQLNAIETTGERRAELEASRARWRAAYEEAAAALTHARTDAAGKLARRVVAELSSLAMERTVFRAAIERSEPSEHGWDEITFLVSANTGEEPKPLDRVASGGELSRIALALKTCVTDKHRTMVFDEVDAGIGGRAAENVGRRLKGLAGANQVLCVTHLAQIAGFADRHFVVEKRQLKGRVTVSIDELQGESRVREIGRMLSGERLTPEALKHAEQLIHSSAESNDR